MGPKQTPIVSPELPAYHYALIGAAYLGTSFFFAKCIVTDPSGGPKYLILPVTGAISYRCFKGCHKFFWCPLKSAYGIFPVKLHFCYFGPPHRPRCAARVRGQRSEEGAHCHGDLLPRGRERGRLLHRGAGFEKEASGREYGAKWVHLEEFSNAVDAGSRLRVLPARLQT